MKLLTKHKVSWQWYCFLAFTSTHAINQGIKFKHMQNTIYVRVKIITDELHVDKYLYTMPVIIILEDKTHW